MTGASTALLTGATGKVGNATARRLVAAGYRVRALVRDPERAARSLPAGVEPIAGDVRDRESLDAAVRGCELVFNAMGLPEQWLRDPRLFDEVNAAGTERLAQAARAAGVRRLVHTSTIDVFHAERGGRFDEGDLATYPKGTAYERSKQRAEKAALAARDGMEVVVLNPAAVYGPGPAASVSLDENMFLPLTRGLLPALPPGGIGVVFTEGVAEGQLLAAERGADGRRYILSDRHVSIRELAETVVRVAGHGRTPPTLPPPLAHLLAAAGEGLSRLTGFAPLLSRGQLHFFEWNAAPYSARAQEELGWEPTLLEDGVARTLEELRRSRG